MERQFWELKHSLLWIARRPPHRHCRQDGRALRLPHWQLRRGAHQQGQETPRRAREDPTLEWAAMLATLRPAVGSGAELAAVTGPQRELVRPTPLVGHNTVPPELEARRKDREGSSVGSAPHALTRDHPAEGSLSFERACDALKAM
mmetsp:Transcript_93730/g.162153  ORF Transcript_93730/g.162153 Transcript_93730/m.162153 type:complete len:146 (-) Transcript_93730:71-508(-)